MTATAFADECIHGLTEAWCSICCDQAAAQRARELIRDSPQASMWHHPSTPDGPKAVASYSSCCNECEDLINVGDLIFLRAGSWMCKDSAVLYDQLDRSMSQHG